MDLDDYLKQSKVKKKKENTKGVQLQRGVTFVLRQVKKLFFELTAEVPSEGFQVFYIEIVQKYTAKFQSPTHKRLKLLIPRGFLRVSEYLALRQIRSK